MQFPDLDIAALRQQRERYSYPTVALESCTELRVRHFDATMAMDQYHNELLGEMATASLLLGYMSVLFWGYYSGQDGRIREGRAFGKVRLAYEGVDRTVKGKSQRVRGVLDYGPDPVASALIESREAIDRDDYELSLELLMGLPGLQLAFASKICAFMAPEKCGVMDSVIAGKYPCLGFEMQGSPSSSKGVVKGTRANRRAYGDYCRWLQQVAADANRHPEHGQWVDRDGRAYPWRALDVERALY